MAYFFHETLDNIKYDRSTMSQLCNVLLIILVINNSSAKKCMCFQVCNYWQAVENVQGSITLFYSHFMNFLSSFPKIMIIII